MNTSAHRLQHAAKAASVSWLFWITLCFGCFLAIYTPYMSWTCAMRQTSERGLSASVIVLALTGALACGVGIRWCGLLILSYSKMVRQNLISAGWEGEILPYISILVPAYCEAACVQDAMNAIIRLDYPAYEIIFVDDGSSDESYQLALPFAGQHHSASGVCDVRVFTKPNQGKWSAHNFGLKKAIGEFILCIDADSRIEADALRLMISHMKDERVGAVSGQIKVRNRNSILGMFQALEYVLANGALRLSQGATGCVMIVPGPIGLFRRQALDAVEAENKRNPERVSEKVSPAADGPFSPLTFAEDFHLSLTMLSLGYRVEYEPHAIAHTKAPSTIPSLISQRYRWNRGTMQVLSWYLRRTLRGGDSPVKLKAWISAAFLLDYYCFPALYFAFLAGLLFYFVQGGNLVTLACWAAAACMLNVMSGSMYAIAHRDNVLLSLLSPLFDLYQGVLLNGAWVVAILDQVRGTAMRW